MKLITQYPIRIDKWHHPNPNGKSAPLQSTGLIYTFGISPQDPKNETGYYFTVTMGKSVNDFTSDIFIGKASQTFLILIPDNDIPAPEVLFPLVEKSAFAYAAHFHLQTRNTNLQHHRIDIPQFENLKSYLQGCIEHWEQFVRNISSN